MIVIAKGCATVVGHQVSFIAVFIGPATTYRVPQIITYNLQISNAGSAYLSNMRKPHIFDWYLLWERRGGHCVQGFQQEACFDCAIGHYFKLILAYR